MKILFNKGILAKKLIILFNIIILFNQPSLAKIATKIVVTGLSEGFKQLDIVLGAWLAREFGVPAP